MFAELCRHSVFLSDWVVHGLDTPPETCPPPPPSIMRDDEKDGFDQRTREPTEARGQINVELKALSQAAS